MMKSFNKILVIRLRSIGDIIVSTPLLTHLRRQYPSARITYLAEEKFSDLIAHNPNINDLMLFNKPPGLTGELEFIRRIRAGNFDLVIDVHGGPRTAIWSFLSGAKTRVGFDILPRRFLYTHCAPRRHPAEHAVEVVLNLARRLGSEPVQPLPLVLIPSAEDKEYADKFFRGNSLSPSEPVAIHPGAKVEYKQWPLERFAEVADYISRKHSRRIILLGGGSDKKYVDAIARKMQTEPVIAPEMTLGRLAAVLSLCGLFIGHDSGPMHMSAAVGTPVVCFFGPSPPETWKPWIAPHVTLIDRSLPCVPCYQRPAECPHFGNHCMTLISQEQAITAIGELIDLKGAGKTIK